VRCHERRPAPLRPDRAPRTVHGVVPPKQLRNGARDKGRREGGLGKGASDGTAAARTGPGGGDNNNNNNNDNAKRTR
jgi:hypothetical protein